MKLILAKYEFLICVNKSSQKFPNKNIKKTKLTARKYLLSSYLRIVIEFSRNIKYLWFAKIYPDKVASAISEHSLTQDSDIKNGMSALQNFINFIHGAFLVHWVMKLIKDLPWGWGTLLWELGTGKVLGHSQIFCCIFRLCRIPCVSFHHEPWYNERKSSLGVSALRREWWW